MLHKSKQVSGDGGLNRLAVDVDGYPAGACLCHKLMFCGKYGRNVRHRMGRVLENRSRAFGCGFVSLMSATTIVVVKSGLM